MQFDELCALVGALRDRVAELEAKEAARAEREARTQVINGGSAGRWVEAISLAGADGSPDIAAIVEKTVASAIARSLKATGGMAAAGHYRIGERGPEAILPAEPDRAAQIRNPAVAAPVLGPPLAVKAPVSWPKF